MSGPGRRFVLTFLLLLLASASWVMVLGQPSEDPRNSGEFFEAVEGTQCFACHTGDGFRPIGVRVLTNYVTLPVGEIVDLEVEVWHNSLPKPSGRKMTHELRDLVVTVDTHRALNVEVITEDFVEDVDIEWAESVAPGQEARSGFDVFADATELSVTVTRTEFTAAVPGEDMRVAVKDAHGALHEASGDGATRAVHLDGDALEAAGAGRFEVRVGYDHPLPQAADPAVFQVALQVNYDQVQTVFRFEPDPDNIRGADPAPEQRRTVIVPVRITSEDPAVLDFRAETWVYWPHQAKDQAPGDTGLYYRFTTMAISGGTEAVRAQTVSGPVLLAPVDLENMFARIVGYTTMVLVPVAMVTGGVFGKSSRRTLNRMVGGAKRRLMWHNAMSFMIIGVATTHFLFALLEPQFVWTRGLFWGGVGWALLVGLGITGWYQTTMIKRWSYRVWRHVHLWSAVGVFAFGVIHMVLEGSDLAFVRHHLPAGHTRLIWP